MVPPPPHIPLMSSVLRRILYGVAALATAFGLVWIIDHFYFQEEAPPPEAYTVPAQPRVESGLLPVSMALNEERSLIVERVLPGVVSVHVDRESTVTETVVRPGGSRTVERTVTEPGIGSGAFISKEGHIVTNWHVVEGGRNIRVTLYGEEAARRATLLDKDDQVDIALLKVEPRRPGEEFPALRLGDSDTVKRGHMVLAMGSPFNLRETITDGIISHRERRVSDTRTAYLQTTCTINPGNSGGPLVNLDGDIIGLVTRKLLGQTSSAAAEGYGLAIPSNDVSDAVDRLRSKDRPRLYLGLTVVDWPEQYWQTKGEPEAVVVKGVTSLSPAERAGLQVDDVIESIDSTRITSTAQYSRAIRQRRVGDSVMFVVRRGDEARRFTAVIADFDKAVPPVSEVKPVTVRGVTLRVLRRGERNLLGLDEAIGLAVESVTSTSPLSPWLSPGMNVLHLSTPDRVTVTPVATPERFAKLLDSLAPTGGFFITGATGECDRWIEFTPLP
jgi:S1-C subfamily serine protease